eukprot:9502316-Pyramimonas_sp.AAC.1
MFTLSQEPASRWLSYELEGSGVRLALGFCGGQSTGARGCGAIWGASHWRWGGTPRLFPDHEKRTQRSFG